MKKTFTKTINTFPISVARLLLLVCLFAYTGNAYATIRYVKATGTGNGTSWQDASNDFQAMINASIFGDTVWVAGGTYLAPLVNSFNMKEGVKIYGGFAGKEEVFTQRNLTDTTNMSTLQGNGYTVMMNYNNGLTESAVLDGFTITGGVYGGFANYSSSPTLSNLIIRYNIDAGMSNVKSSPILTNCSIIGNITEAGGNGVYNLESSPVLINCVIAHNINKEYGGGMLNIKSSPNLINCLITGNRSRVGGGIYNQASTTVLTNCTISGNIASEAAGGGGVENGNYLRFGDSYTQLRNTIVYGNSSGIENESGSTMDIKYSLVQGETNLNPDDHNLPADSNPLFVNAAKGDFRVKSCSPVIDRGNDYYASGQTPDLSFITTDLDNNLRKLGTAVDLGVYEFTGTPATPSLADDHGGFSGDISGDFTIMADGASCAVMAKLSPNGSSPLSGELTAKVWVEDAQPVNFLKRHYEITPATNAETATARVTLYFTQQEFTDFNAVSSVKLPVDAEDTDNHKAHLLIEKRSGTSSDSTGLPSTYTGSVVTINPLDPAVNWSILWNSEASRWEVSFNVTGFSGFFAKTTDDPLPLNLVSFTASKETGSNLLQWKTTSEVNSSFFEVQHSRNASVFTTLGAIQVNSNDNYHYTHTSPFSGINYYRLMMVDRDGTFAYSKIISLTNEGNRSVVYPNPASTSITITINPPLLQSTATLYDVMGRQLQSIRITTNGQQINVTSLASGVYILKFADGTAERFVKE